MLRLLRGSGDETTAAEALRRAGVSRATVERFFAPFLRGVFLEEQLTTSSRFLDFVLRSFSEGAAALPRDGMGAIAAQLAEGLEIRTGTGRRHGRPARRLARDGRATARRRGRRGDRRDRRRAAHGWNGVTCVYFDAPAPPIPGPWLVVNGEGGPINNLCVPSEAVPGYAPAGRSLVSVTILGAAEPDLDAVGAPAARLVRRRGDGMAAPADVPDSAGAARLPGRRLGSGSRRGSRRASTPAATTASIRR